MDILFGSSKDWDNHEQRMRNDDNYVRDLASRIQRAHDAANEYQLEEAKKMKATYDARTKPIKPYAVGKTVYLYTPNVGAKKGPRKLMHKWSGPYTVVEFLAPNNVIIEDNVKKTRKTVHVLRVREVPKRPEKWMQDGEVEPAADNHQQANQPMELATELVAWQDKEMAGSNPNHFYLGIPEVDQTGEDEGFVRVHQWDAQQRRKDLAKTKWGPLTYKWNADGVTWEERTTRKKLRDHIPWVTSVPRANVFETGIQLDNRGFLPTGFLTSYVSKLKTVAQLIPGKPM